MVEISRRGLMHKLVTSITLAGLVLFFVPLKKTQRHRDSFSLPAPTANWTLGSYEVFHNDNVYTNNIRRLANKVAIEPRGGQLEKKARTVEKKGMEGDPPEKRKGQKLVAPARLRTGGKGGSSKSSKTSSSGKGRGKGGSSKSNKASSSGKGSKGKGGTKSSGTKNCKGMNGKGKGGKGKGGKSSSSDSLDTDDSIDTGDDFLDTDEECKDSIKSSKTNSKTSGVKGTNDSKGGPKGGKSDKTTGKKKSKKTKGSLDCSAFTFSRRLQQQDFCTPNLLMTAEMLPLASFFFDLLEIADLSDLLICPGPFTVLAPANTAFQALDPFFLESLIQPRNVEALRTILLRHIVQGLHPGSTLQPGSLTSLAGDMVQAQVNPIMFDDSGVANTGDILACNGAIYVLENVLGFGDAPALPPVMVPLPPPPTSAPVLSPIPPPPTNAPVLVPQPPPPTSAPINPPPPPTNAPIPAPPPPTNAPVLEPPPPPTNAPVLEPPPPIAAPMNPPTSAPLTPPTDAPVALPPTEAPVIPTVPPVPPPTVSPTTAPMPVPTESPTVAPSVAAVPATPAPTDEPPTEEPTAGSQPVVVRTDDIFMSFFADGATESPTMEEFETLVQLTTDYWQEYLENSFAGDPDRSFLGIEAMLGTAAFGIDAQIPAERFNIYLEFEYIDIFFEPGSVAPDPANVVSLLKGSITTDYILNIPRMMTGTPFASSREVVLAQTGSAIPLDP